MTRKVFRLIAACLPLLFISCADQADRPVDQTPAATQKERASDDGIQEVYDKDGVLVMRGRKVAGKRHGDWESYFPDGSLRSRATYQHGLRQGSSTVFHENGRPFYSGIYLDDRMVGDWLFFDKEGNTVKVVRYDNQGNKLEERAL